MKTKLSKNGFGYLDVYYLDELMIGLVNVDVYKPIVTNSAGTKILFINNEYIKDLN